MVDPQTVMSGHLMITRRGKNLNCRFRHDRNMARVQDDVASRRQYRRAQIACCHDVEPVGKDDRFAPTFGGSRAAISHAVVSCIAHRLSQLDEACLIAGR
mgnify:FL=1